VVFAGVPLVIESDDKDWSRVPIEGPVHSAESHSRDMRVVLLPDTTVDLYL
jgi:hypothetical protein